MSGWQNSYTGVKYFPLAFQPDMVRIKDMAHGLAGRMRYGCQTWVSVAQHSVVVLAVVERLIQLTQMEARFVFFHDGSEYVLPDMPAPIKSDERMAWFCEIEDQVQGCIYEAVGVDVALVRDEVKEMLKTVDRLVCNVEKKHFKEVHPHWQDAKAAPRTEQIAKPVMFQGYLGEWSPQKAEKKFLETAKKLGVS